MTKRVLWGVIVLLVCIIQIVQAQAVTSYHYAWSQDGSRFVVGTQNDTSFVVTVYDAQWQPLASRSLPCCTMSLSPDGKELLINSDPSEILDIDTLQTLRILSSSIRGGIWSPDGRELASFDSGPPGRITFYSAVDGRLLREFTRETSDAWGWPDGPVWSPNGAMFAVYLSSQLVLLDAATGKEISRYTLDGDINVLSWSADSTRIAISLTKQAPTGATGDSSDTHDLNSIVVMEVATGHVLTLQSGFRSWVWRLVWSPDNTQIVTWLDGDLTILDSTNGHVIDTFVADGLRLIDYSPTGGRLFLANGGAASTSELNETSSNKATDQSESLSALDGMIQIVVPAPSPDLLTSIEAACVPAQAQIALPAAEALLKQGRVTDDDPLTAYINAVRTDATIPAACAADLIAVAEALQGK